MEVRWRGREGFSRGIVWSCWGLRPHCGQWVRNPLAGENLPFLQSHDTLARPWSPDLEAAQQRFSETTSLGDIPDRGSATAGGVDSEVGSQSLRSSAVSKPRCAVSSGFPRTPL